MSHIEGTLKANGLIARRLKWHAQDDAIILMRTDCPVCRAEGLSSRTRVLVSSGDRDVIATLHQIDSEWLNLDEAGLSETAWTRLGVEPGELISVRHAPTLPSLSDVRSRMTGNRLDDEAFNRIIRDVAAGRYSDIHLAAFLSACSTLKLDVDEISSLTNTASAAFRVIVRRLLLSPFSPVLALRFRKRHPAQSRRLPAQPIQWKHSPLLIFPYLIFDGWLRLKGAVWPGGAQCSLARPMIS